MDISDNQRNILIWSAVTIASIFMLVLGLAFSAVLFPKPKIGVIYADQVIGAAVMPYFTIPLTYAKEHDDIVAVVMVVDSPGGTAATSEELFYRIADLREEKPVVASINRLGASGSYYMSVGANYIYAKPAALVGSIGVISGIPGEGDLTEFEATTGPFKSGGSSAVDYIRGMEVIKNSFVSNVYDNRLYALEHMHPESRAEVLPDKDHIGTGQVWFAPVAYDVGLIDALGSDLDAIEKAADLANVSNYEIVDLTGLALFEDGTFIYGAEAPQPDALLEWWPQEDYLDAGPWPTFYHLYIPPENYEE